MLFVANFESQARSRSSQDLVPGPGDFLLLELLRVSLSGDGRGRKKVQPKFLLLSVLQPKRRNNNNKQQQQHASSSAAAFLLGLQTIDSPLRIIIGE